FVSDRTIRDAALYNIVIIGEAARYVPADIQARCPDVDWNSLKDMRNWVAHVYHAVSNRRVWSTITADLPEVIAQLQTLLADETGSQG
ncbi:MAG TPA: HepT-like ribonuclease domain-containing protein, partial [Longimicrobium sp.]